MNLLQQCSSHELQVKKKRVFTAFEIGSGNFILESTRIIF